MILPAEIWRQLEYAVLLTRYDVKRLAIQWSPSMVVIVSAIFLFPNVNDLFLSNFASKKSRKWCRHQINDRLNQVFWNKIPPRLTAIIHVQKGVINCISRTKSSLSLTFSGVNAYWVARAWVDCCSIQRGRLLGFGEIRLANCKNVAKPRLLL